MPTGVGHGVGGTPGHPLRAVGGRARLRGRGYRRASFAYSPEGRGLAAGVILDAIPPPPLRPGPLPPLPLGTLLPTHTVSLSPLLRGFKAPGPVPGIQGGWTGGEKRRQSSKLMKKAPEKISGKS